MMVYTLKRIIVYSLIISILALFVYTVATTENKSFNSVGNVFSNSEVSNKNRESKEPDLTEDFWTSGRFNFK